MKVKLYMYICVGGLDPVSVCILVGISVTESPRGLGKFTLLIFLWSYSLSGPAIIPLILT